MAIAMAPWRSRSRSLTTRITSLTTLALITAFVGKGFRRCEGSLVNKVVLQSLNITSPSSPIDTSLWENKDNGFQVQTAQTRANVNDWGPAIGNEGFPPNFLSAQKTATLSTVLHNFNHTFLSVHFLSFIGTGIRDESLITEAGVEENSTTNLFDQSTTAFTVTPEPTSAAGGANMAEIPQSPVIVQQPSPEVMNAIQDQASSQSAPSPRSASTSAPVPGVGPAIITSTVTGPNNSSTSHIIQITLEHQDPGPTPTPAPASAAPVSETRENANIRVKRELDSGEISQVREIFVKALSNTASTSTSATTTVIPAPESMKPSTPSIVEGIQESMNTTQQPQESTGADIQPPTTLGAPVLNVPAVPVTELLVPAEGPEQKLSDHESQRLVIGQPKPTEREAGFYVVVDDKVVYDNWNGILKHPDIMGNTIQSPGNNLWEETNIFIDVGPLVPHRDVKVSFEWEPSNSSSFILLNDIALGTLEGPSGTMTPQSQPQVTAVTETGNVGSLSIISSTEASEVSALPTTMESTTTSEPTAQTLAPAVLHNNITLYIVVKSQSHDPRDRNNADNDTVVEPIGNETVAVALNDSIITSDITSTTPKSTGVMEQKANEIIPSSSSSPAAPVTVPVTQYMPKVLNRDPSLNGFDSVNSSDLSAIIVFGILVIVTILICIGLIHRKIENRKHQRGRC